MLRKLILERARTKVSSVFERDQSNGAHTHSHSFIFLATETNFACLTARKVDENNGGSSKKIKFEDEEDDTDDDDDFIPPAISMASCPDHFMYMWTNGYMRECIDVVVTLGSGTTSHSKTNVKVKVTDDGGRSAVLLTHRWNETMMDADEIYANVKDENKDVHFHNCMAAMRVFLANTFGLPGSFDKESTVCIHLPIKVRDVNPKITAVKKDSNGSRLLVISMESAKEAKQAKLSENLFEVLDCDDVTEVAKKSG
jgi:hypothetical protein